MIRWIFEMSERGNQMNTAKQFLLLKTNFYYITISSASGVQQSPHYTTVEGWSTVTGPWELATLISVSNADIYI